MSTATMPTVEEREFLKVPSGVKHSGFTPRPIQKLAERKKPRTMLNIECNHFLRTKTDAFTHGHPMLGYKLWLEAGKHEAPYPSRPDDNYNSNVWRNFRRQYGFSATADGRKISDVIASMYPLNIPPPSQVGDHTFDKFIRESSLFNNDKMKALAMERTKNDVVEFKRLRVKSDARNPPLDESGQIVPPENFRKYEHRFVPPPLPPPTPPPANQKTDSLGQRYVPKSEPHLWKLSYKLSNPQYEHVRQEIRKRQQMMKEETPQSPQPHIPKNFPSPVNRKM
ncbi:testis-expressed protein 52-like [Ylistrum balloti]|uniref:testis-expressed protein 52-like n=1 Tax=Ylistrum balloti TaxID=509963 RepID=UPI002905D71F|nr:testis-expressed protein 52-like [Ylistrum balloti]